jgi:hypothetical protein
MTAPVRIQLSRKKGFDLQAHSRALNNLPAVNCARPSLFSNPFPIGKPSGFAFEDGGDPTPLIAQMTREDSLRMFRDFTEGFIYPEMHPWGHDWQRKLTARIGGAYPYEWIKAQLRGKNLACWCKPSEACHCDHLLEIANP